VKKGNVGVTGEVQTPSAGKINRGGGNHEGIKTAERLEKVGGEVLDRREGLKGQLSTHKKRSWKRASASVLIEGNNAHFWERKKK